MGISERKERDKQEMRKSIIDAAMHIFMKDGYEAASIRKIADKIEYSPATIYLYYKDKDELLYDVQAECFSKMVAEFKRDITSTDPFTRLTQLGHSYLRFGLTYPEIYDLMFMMDAPMHNVEECDVWENADDAFGILMQTVSACMEKGVINFPDAGLAAVSLWSICHGMLSLNISCRMKVMGMENEQIAQTMYATLDNYLNTIKR